MTHKVVGIDLGTTYSAVAAYDEYTEQAEIISNLEAAGDPTTPSVVGLDPLTGKVIVGHAAKRNLPNDPQNTVIEIKREMGELFTAETLQKFGASGTWSVGRPVQARFADEWLMPQELSAFILMKMKEIAETAIGEEVRDAVITVPAYFTANQKKATEEAALLAGLYPRQLIPEPTAAAICYGVDRMDPERRVYMVYDLGGGTFDVSIIDVQEQKIDVIATSGDPRLGGGDFDDEVTRWATSVLKDEHQINVYNDPGALAYIKNEAEKAKIKLSIFGRTEMSLISLRPQRPPVLVLTREQFEGMITPYLVKSLTFVEQALRGADAKGVRREDVSAILLVGGSTRIPLVRARLLDYFGKGKDFVRDDLDPAAVVARGAAILARRFQPSPPPFDILHRQDSSVVHLNPDDASIALITEHSLGVRVQEDRFHKIIGQGKNIPMSQTEGGFANMGPTDVVQVQVFQGEGEYVFDNTQIGVIAIPVEPREAHHHQFEVTFSLDESGLLSVEVKHLNTGRVFPAKFEHETSTKGPEALGAMRSKLLRRYQPGAGDLPPPPLEETGGVEPPYEVPSPPSDSSTPRPDAARGMEASAPDAEAPAPPEPAPAGGASDPMAILEATGEMPKDCTGIVRRARKQLLAAPNEKLILALNALIAAINEGRSEEEITDLADILEDAYHDARTAAPA